MNLWSSGVPEFRFKPGFRVLGDHFLDPPNLSTTIVFIWWCVCVLVTEFANNVLFQYGLYFEYVYFLSLGK